MVTEPTETIEFQPPYLSWATFEGILDGLARDGIPDQIDRSVLRGKSGTDQGQFLRAAQSFGLIDGEGVPTERLRALIVEQHRRPEIYREILQERYPDVIALGTGATQQQLEDTFRKFPGIGGDTVRKAIAFYLNAAKQAEIPLSPRFKSTRPGAGGRKARRPRAAGASGTGDGAAGDDTRDEPKKSLPEIVDALVTKLPAKGESWTAEEAKWWLQMAGMAFPREYGFDPPEGGLVP
jgi:hypothetical protein